MSISRYKRTRRAALAAMRRTKCTQHRVPGCESRTCRIEIVNKFYGTGKKGGNPPESSPENLEKLFRSLHQPTKLQGEF